MSARHGMVIELDRCIGCSACVTACAETWDTGPGTGRNWVRSHESGTRASGLELTFYPGLCMHCLVTPCVRACPTGATYADEHGRVVVDPAVCVGCGSCVPACPYGARVVDESSGMVAKCDFCAPRVDAGQEPACVTTCPAGCRVFGNLDDPNAAVNQRLRETSARPLLTPAVMQGPKVYFSGERERRRLLAAGEVGEPAQSGFARGWALAVRPFGRWLVPLAAAGAVLAGLLLELARRTREVGEQERAERPEGLSGALPPNPRQACPEQPAERACRRGRSSPLDPPMTGESLAHVPGQVSSTVSLRLDELSSVPGPGGGTPPGRGPGTASPGSGPGEWVYPPSDTLPRHHLALRLLHWFNAASFVVLGVSGVALFANERFSIAGEALSAWAAGLTGGAAGLMRLHVLWGVAWALTVVPAFLLFKRGGFEALRELRPTRDDLVWLWRKPLVMVGLSRAELPPQDKYNAGQKLFAAAVLGLVTVVIASGAAIALHLGPPEAVSAAIAAHGLAVGLLLAGLGVHFTMAAVISEERPALWSMLTGSISRSHAESHYARWAAEVLARQGPRAPGTEEAPPA